MARPTEPNRQLPQIALRGYVGSSESPLIAGITILGGLTTLLIRGIGSSLTQFGIVNPCERPTFVVVTASGIVLARSMAYYGLNEETRSRYTGIFEEAGAFAFLPGTNDGLLIVDLQPGAYSIVLTSEGNTGVGMIEVYTLKASKR